MKRIFSILFCFTVLLTSCKKDDKNEPEEPETPVTTGNLSGKVYHYDQFGTLYTSGRNTTTVSIEGQSFSTVTDTAGQYTLTNVPSNTYTIVFKKPSCGLIKRKNIYYKFTDTVTYSASIADIPTFTIPNAYAKDTTWFSGTLGGIFYSAASSLFNTKASIVAIVGKSPSLNLGDPASYLNYPTSSLVTSVDFHRFYSYALLRDTYTFKQDSILYLKIYPVATNGSNYYDNTLNTLVYTAFGTPYPTVFQLYVH